MIADRTRGALLYSLAGAVLAGGGVWYFGAAPGTGLDPRVAQWQETVELLLPDRPLQTMADTIVVTGDITAERTTPVEGGGSYLLSVVCAGTGQVRVRLSSSDGRDSGRAVRCSGEPVPEEIRVGLADEFYMSVAGEQGDAVFRWRLEQVPGF